MPKLSLQDYLYTCKTVTEVLERFTADLISNGDTLSIIHANKLISYQNMIKDKGFTRDCRKLFNEIYNLIDKTHPDLHFSLEGRRKSLISTEQKILQYTSLCKSLDLIRDFFAFRIILFGNESINLVRHCYQVMEVIIDFAVKQGFSPCERLPLLDVVNINDHKTPYFSPFKYKMFVKDYICFPKENGYQSMHLVLVDTKERHLEIQIRTLNMHAQIESGMANHEVYKQKKYNIDFPLEREKISINGYSYVNGQVFDFAGVENPITVFQRQKTF